MIGIPILGKPKGSWQEAFNTAVKRGAQNLEFLRAYLIELYRFAPLYGINPDVLVAQFSQETGDGTSDYYRLDGNVAGFGVPSKGPSKGYTFTPVAAAQCQVIHMGLYLGLDISPEDQKLDVRWQAGIDAGYFGLVKTTADLGNGLWAEDKDYAKGLFSRYVAYWGTPQSVEGEPMEKKYGIEDVYILVVSGHRSTGDPGNPTERSLTDDLAKADVAAFRAAGFRADWFQRDLDGDSLPDMTQGDLTTVSIGARNAIAKAPEKLTIMFDDHYNGPHSAAHAIPPDNVGLRTGFAGGAPADDNASVQTLDVKIGSAVILNICKATGLKVYNGRLKVPGVMSERDTGVALSGNWRLGMLAATAPYRARACRMIIEHGGYEDVKQDAKFFNACAMAKVKAVVDVLGIDAEIPDPGDIGTIPPKPAENLPKPIPGLDGSKLVQHVDGSDFYRTRVWVRAIRTTARLRAANDDPASSEGLAPVEAGDPPFKIEYTFIADNKKKYALSSYNTRFLADDLEVVDKQ